MKTLAVLFFLILTSSLRSQVRQIGDDLYFYTETPSEHANNCGADIKFNPEIHQNLTGPYDVSAVSFDWPFSQALDEGVVIVNYVDDLAGGSIRDYNDNDWSYNGHNGTDIALHDFRNMDRFYAVRAAASGTVVELTVNNFDRNTGLDNGIPSNTVLIRHNDGTYAYYFHMMKKSATVKLGEYILQGQILGYVGSSGNSTDAHLHFEPGHFSNGNWIKRDPWEGVYNQLPSLWQSQYAYVGFRDFILHDMGVYTKGLVGGNMVNSPDYFKERIITPYTVSGYEDKLGFWILVQGNYSGKQIRFEIRKSDGSLFDDTYFYMSDQTQYGRYWWTPDFNPGISVTGDWYVRVLYDNVEKGRYFFNVQLLTSNRPRMYPVAAKCFRKSIFVQRDTLRVRPVRSNMQYDLVNAPPEVTITQDSILNIGSFSQTFRVRDFKVIASIGGNSALRDTMLYKLIDTTNNNASGNGIESLELNAKIEGFWDGSTMQSDTVTVIIRAPLSPYLIVDSAKIVLNSNGYALANFFNISSGINYYIVLKHRNSIETWSKTTQQFSSGYPINYDFTTSKTKAYGDNLKLKNSEYCIYSGDVNQSGSIDLTDLLQVYNISDNFFQSTYAVTDTNGDEITDLTDILITYNNSINFITKMRP